MQVELIADYGCVCGENPLWHPDEKRLYWVDIETGRIFRYDPAAGSHEQCLGLDGEMIGAFTLQSDGSFLLFMSGGAVKSWRNGTLTTVVDRLPGEEDGRFNDVIADPEGRVYCGTMSTVVGARRGSLYRLDRDGSIRKVLTEVGLSNGMGFTPDRRQMYYTDSMAHEIYLFDYDPATGVLANRRVFAQVPDVYPDGLTVDAEGYVWGARAFGGCVVRYDPAGKEVARISFPDALGVTSVAFGGPDFSDLYVTSLGGNDKEKLGAASGALFRVRTGVRGLPEFRSRVAL